MLDPEAKAFLDEMAAAQRPALSSLSPVEARKLAYDLLALGGESQPVARVEDRQIPSPFGKIPIRIYVPAADGPLPVLMYFHGGGWVVCDLETHDSICRRLANGGACIVVAVDYRLAPEHKFPAAPEDCFAATLWAYQHAKAMGGDPARLGVAGDSAGGNLATVVSLMARDHGGPPLAFQLLVYPVTDHYSRARPSYEENAEGFHLTRESMIWFWDHYLPSPAAAHHVYACPLLAMNLSDLPPALVITAEHDPLRDEGEAYAERLKAAGVPVTLSRYNGMFHPFFSMAGRFAASRRCFDECGAALRNAFSTRGKSRVSTSG